MELNEKTEDEKKEIVKDRKGALADVLADMIKSFENLPPHAMAQPITHYDHLSLMHLLLALVQEDCKEEI